MRGLESGPLRPIYTCDFSYDFGAILRTKPAPAYPARVFSRVNAATKYRQISRNCKKGVFK